MSDGEDKAPQDPQADPSQVKAPAKNGSSTNVIEDAEHTRREKILKCYNERFAKGRAPFG